LFVISEFSDALNLIGVAAAIGAVTGFITSLTRAPAGRKGSVFGIDNRLRFARRYKNKGKTRAWGIDLGSLGPTLIGAGGAVFVVFVTGVDKATVDTVIVDAISDTQLVILAIAGGAAGELVFRTLAAGGKVTLQSANAAVADAAKAASDAVDKGVVEPGAIHLTALEAGTSRLEDPETEETDAGANAPPGSEEGF
jgi:hypothetical protein